jgi:hypothetical protein
MEKRTIIIFDVDCSAIDSNGFGVAVEAATAVQHRAAGLLFLQLGGLRHLPFRLLSVINKM